MKMRFSSLIQDKNSRIQDTTSRRSLVFLGKEFQIETTKGLAKKFKQKMSFSRDLLSGNRLPEDVIEG